MDSQNTACKDYSLCTFEQQLQEWSAWSECAPGCGNSTRKRQRGVVCRRSDGLLSSMSQCITYGNTEGSDAVTGALKEEVMQCENFDTCEYDWNIGEWAEWGDCEQTCGRSERTRTRVITCLRSDGVIVEDSLCEDDEEPEDLTVPEALPSSPPPPPPPVSI